MDVSILSVRKIFSQDRRHLVPMFQRPYVWGEKEQWGPFWDDIRNIAERLLNDKDVRPHFLGAIVLDQIPKPTGEAQTLMRHASPEMTMNVYARTRGERLGEIAEKVGDVMSLGDVCAIDVQSARGRERRRNNKAHGRKELHEEDDSSGVQFDSHRLHHFSIAEPIRNRYNKSHKSLRAFLLHNLTPMEVHGTPTWEIQFLHVPMQQMCCICAE